MFRRSWCNCSAGADENTRNKNDANESDVRPPAAAPTVGHSSSSSSSRRAYVSFPSAVNTYTGRAEPRRRGRLLYGVGAVRLDGRPGRCCRDRVRGGLLGPLRGRVRELARLPRLLRLLRVPAWHVGRCNRRQDLVPRVPARHVRSRQRRRKPRIEHRVGQLGARPRLPAVPERCERSPTCASLGHYLRASFVKRRPLLTRPRGAHFRRRLRRHVQRGVGRDRVRRLSAERDMCRARHRHAARARAFVHRRRELGAGEGYVFFIFSFLFRAWPGGHYECEPAVHHQSYAGVARSRRSTTGRCSGKRPSRPTSRGCRSASSACGPSRQTRGHSSCSSS